MHACSLACSDMDGRLTRFFALLTDGSFRFLSSQLPGLLGPLLIQIELEIVEIGLLLPPPPFDVAPSIVSSRGALQFYGSAASRMMMVIWKY